MKDLKWARVYDVAEIAIKKTMRFSVGTQPLAEFITDLSRMTILLLLDLSRVFFNPINQK
jgi:hypothetical protein